MISKTRMLPLVKDLGVTAAEIMGRKRDPEFRAMTRSLL
jgi:hypothetical protein